jgi:hypothetical protein
VKVCNGEERKPAVQRLLLVATVSFLAGQLCELWYRSESFYRTRFQPSGVSQTSGKPTFKNGFWQWSQTEFGCAAATVIHETDYALTPQIERSKS